MTLKTLCFAFTDEFQQELSELMYKETMRHPGRDRRLLLLDRRRAHAAAGAEAAEAAAADAAVGRAAEKAGAAKAKADAASAMDSPPAMDELLRKYDTDGSISSLIEMERETPEDDARG